MEEKPSQEGTLDRERDFFDAEADRHAVAEMPPREYAPFDSQFEDALIDAAGELTGANVLDLGCGTGDLTLRLLQRGARVTAVDLSPQSVEVARRRAERFVPEAEASFQVAPAHATGLPAQSFDLVLGKWVLHHLDLELVLPELRRLLKPGGRGVFVETSGLNPVLVATRRLAGHGGIAKYGTPDERPISRANLARIRSEFPRCEVDYPNFVFFFLLDRHLLKWRFQRASRALRAADRAIERRVKRLGPMSYFLRIQIEA